MKTGDRVTWRKDYPDRDALEQEFGPGPFTVRDIEDDPQGGQRVSLTNEEGMTFVRGQWKKLEKGPLYTAAPPMFHSEWLEPAP